MMKIPKAHAARALLLAAALVAGCATTNPNYEEGLALFDAGQQEQGLAKLREATLEEPRNGKIRVDYVSRLERVTGRLLASANSERLAGRRAEAHKLCEQVLRIDTGNTAAANCVAALDRDDRLAKQVAESRALLVGGDPAGARAKLEPVLAENPNLPEAAALKKDIDVVLARQVLATPALKAKYQKPVTLEFRDASLKNVFDALSRTTGINFVLDKDTRADTRTTIYARSVSVEDAIDLILVPNQLARKVLSDNALLIYPNTAAKQKEYEELVIKTFHLGNADPKQTLNMLKTLLKTKDVYVDEKVNMLVMRDTPSAVRLAERLIAAQDLAEAEVMLEMEVLEVTRGKIEELGIKYPTQFTGPTGGLSLSEIFTFTSSPEDVVKANAGLILNLKQQDTGVNLLSSPRIRVRNKEKAKLLIGERRPVISSTVTPSTGTPVVTETIQYLDIGLKLEVEPTIHLDNDVAVKVSLEVSSTGEEVTGTAGTKAFVVSTRTASTVLRIRDGDTQILMGLIQDNDTLTTDKVPGLGELPLIGKLFTNDSTNKRKNEIILSITPRIVRTLKKPELLETEFWSGTEAALRLKPLKAETVGITEPVISLTGEPGKAAAGAPGAAAAAPLTADASARPAPLQPLLLAWQGPQSAKIGEEFILTLNGTIDHPLQSAVLQLRYDKDLLEVVAVDEGAFFKQGGGQTQFTQRVDVPTGRIFAGIVRSGTEGAKGTGSLLTVRFKVIGEQPQSMVHLVTASPVGEGNKPVTIKGSGPFALALAK